MVFRNAVAAPNAVNHMNVMSSDEWGIKTAVEIQFSSGMSWKVPTVYPKKYAHCFVVLCFVVVMQSFIMNSHEVFIHIYQGCFAGTGAINRLPQCQWSKADGYGKISQCITTTKHSKAKTVCIFLGIYCALGIQLAAEFHVDCNGSISWAIFADTVYSSKGIDKS